MVEALILRHLAEKEPVSIHDKSRSFVFDAVAEGGNFRHKFIFFPANTYEYSFICQRCCVVLGTAKFIM
jgi:hypothetical protein